MRYIFSTSQTITYRGISVEIATTTPWEYERARGGFETYPLDSFLRSGLSSADSVLYEIGACNGILSVLASQILPQQDPNIVAFEPVPGNVESFATNLRINAITNVLIIPVALSAVDGRAMLYLDSYDPVPGQGGHSLALDHGRGGIEVPSMTLDTAIRVFQLPSPTHISIDVEEHEGSVLRGMRKTLDDAGSEVQVVVVEVGGIQDASESPSTEVLREAGFVLTDQKAAPPGVRPHCMATFVRRDLLP